MRDLNPRPCACKAPALATAPIARKKCSTKWNYFAVIFFKNPKFLKRTILKRMETTLYDILKQLQAQGLLLEVYNLKNTEGDPRWDDFLPNVQFIDSTCGNNKIMATADSLINGLDSNSLYSQKHHIFVCKGAAFKPDYLQDALKKGATAYMCDNTHAQTLRAYCPDATQIVVNDIRLAMAQAAPLAWGHPDTRLITVGITGTKGKTTTACMIKSILDARAQRKHICTSQGKSPIGLMGSITTYDGIINEESTNTTPEAPDFWRHLHNAAESGITHMVMEISSQALKHHRVDGLHLDVALFLNISPDHISKVEHPTFEDYFLSKLMIFSMANAAVMNLDADHFEAIYAHAHTCSPLLVCGRAHAQRRLEAYEPQFLSDKKVASTLKAALNRTLPADIAAHDIRPQGCGLQFSCNEAHNANAQQREFFVPLHGTFNVDNALCAVACADLLHANTSDIQQGLANTHVAGRMEFIPTHTQNIQGIVDYAHNKLSFRCFFSDLAHEFPHYKIIALFGAPGGKAFDRRRDLVEEAAKWADTIMLTEEDPGHERVQDICNEMAKHMPKGQKYYIECNRAAAIEKTVELANCSQAKTLICMLGKGDETTQHEQDRYVSCLPDKDIFIHAVNALKESHDQ